MANNRAGVDSNTKHYSLKVVLLGDSGVGKTSIALRYVQQEFHPFPEPTIGASFWGCTVQLPDEKQVQLRVWDTAGQERYQSLTPLYFRGAHVALLVFDVSKMHTWESLKKWVRELKQFGAGNTILLVVGNKLDLLETLELEGTTSAADATTNDSTDQSLTQPAFLEEARSYADTIGATYIETSAKDGTNISELFQSAAQQAAHKGVLVPEQGDPRNVDLSSTSSPTRLSCCP